MYLVLCFSSFLFIRSTDNKTCLHLTTYWYFNGIIVIRWFMTSVTCDTIILYKNCDIYTGHQKLAVYWFIRIVFFFWRGRICNRTQKSEASKINYQIDLYCIDSFYALFTLNSICIQNTETEKQNECQNTRIYLSATIGVCNKEWCHNNNVDNRYQYFLLLLFGSLYLTI